MSIASIIADWPITLIIAAVAGIAVVATILLRFRDRRHPADTRAGGRHSRGNAHPEGPPHQRAKHYLASGALPRWDP